MTVKAFAIRENVSENTVRRWIRSGLIKGAIRTYSGRLICWDIPEDAKAPMTYMWYDDPNEQFHPIDGEV